MARSTTKRAPRRASAKPSQATSRGGHFSPELFAFFRQLKRNNRRDWFEKNKQRYIEEVRDPCLQFIEDFAPRLHGISKHCVADPRPVGGSLFRIYRDTRFAKDKSPYKTAAGIHFRHERARDAHTPGFYLHLGIDEVFVGTGIWHPDGRMLTRIRNAIDRESSRWKKITGARAFQKTLRLGGDSLIRAPRGFDPGHPLIEDLKRKDFITLTEVDEKTVCAPRFIDRFTEVCRAASPFMKFLAEAGGLKW